MGSNVARVTDAIQGVCDHGENCCPHSVTGGILQGSETTIVENLQVARIGDKVWTTCPHCAKGFITAASEISFAETKGIARIGDSVQLNYPIPGRIVAGAQRTIAG